MSIDASSWQSFAFCLSLSQMAKTVSKKIYCIGSQRASQTHDSGPSRERKNSIAAREKGSKNKNRQIAPPSRIARAIQNPKKIISQSWWQRVSRYPANRNQLNRIVSPPEQASFLVALARSRSGSRSVVRSAAGAVHVVRVGRCFRAARTLGKLCSVGAGTRGGSTLRSVATRRAAPGDILRSTLAVGCVLLLELGQYMHLLPIERRMWCAYLSVLGKVDLEGLGIVFKAQRSHGKENIFTVDSLALFLLALLRCCEDRASASRQNAAHR